MWIGDILHSAKIKVDEKGTTAAAATALKLGKCENDCPIVIFDRPFQAVVFDNTNNMPLFLTQINTLKQN